MRRTFSAGLAFTVLLAALLWPPPAAAYSVLAHEANVDALWNDVIRPLLRQRVPRATATDLEQARAYALGGSVIQDLGYYPFGSRFFSNLLHYVRSGDFVEALIDEARDLDEYAFALGALAHYAADNIGHPDAVNRAVPLMFPKLQAKYGDRVTYADSPKTHVLVEFSFDVVQVAGGKYRPEAYRGFIGFEVAGPLLERTFRRIYDLDMQDVFGDQELAISTYRHAVSEWIPEITRAAWRDKKDEIAKLMPGVDEQQFVFRLSRGQFEREFGGSYRKPGVFARFLGLVYRLVPKVGPLRPLKFEAPTPEAEALFVRSLQETRDRYRDALEAVGRGRLTLANMDFDTGKPAARGEYPLADETYEELLRRLEGLKERRVSAALRRNILAFYQPAEPWKANGKSERKRDEKIRKQLTLLAAGVL